MGFFNKSELDYLRARIAVENALGFDPDEMESEEYMESSLAVGDEILSASAVRSLQLPALFGLARDGNVFAGQEICSHLADLVRLGKELPDAARSYVAQIFEDLGNGEDPLDASFTKASGKTNRYRGLKARALLLLEIAERINAGKSQFEAFHAIQGVEPETAKSYWQNRQKIWDRLRVPYDA